MAVPRPVLRYHGGKFRLAPWIVANLPAHVAYVEPFGGAASVLLHKPRAKVEVYNDLDDEVVGLFRVLRDPEAAGRLRDLVALTPFARGEYEAAFEPCDEPVERARRMLVRSFMGVSSNAATRKARAGFRRKRMGEVTPAADWSSWPEAVGSMVERLRGVVVECRDALEVIRAYDEPGALIYADPPYPRETRTCHHASYRHELTDQDHEDLARALHGLRGAAVVSGYRCDLYDELYAGWRLVSRVARADRAARRTECLWISPGARLGLLDVG
ncbi:MAG: DNA adenine methylase [Desulfovibrionaceae bacterium]